MNGDGGKSRTSDTSDSEVWIDFTEPVEKAHPYQDMPWVLIGEEHRNFADLRLYELDVMFRDWLTKMQARPDYRKREWNLGHRQTSRNVADALGVDTTKFNPDWRRVTDLCAWYASSRVKYPQKKVGNYPDGRVKCKRIAKSGYRFPFKDLRKPYSLRLRWELAVENGEALTIDDMGTEGKLGRVDARKSETRKAQQRRSREAQRRWQERYGGKYPGRWDHDGFPGADRVDELPGEDDR